MQRKVTFSRHRRERGWDHFLPAKQRVRKGVRKTRTVVCIQRDGLAEPCLAGTSCHNLGGTLEGSTIARCEASSIGAVGVEPALREVIRSHRGSGVLCLSFPTVSSDLVRELNP
jgi:hypothetical protein